MQKKFFFLLAFLACYRSINEAGKISVPLGKVALSYGQSKTILLQHFLLWAGPRDDVRIGTAAWFSPGLPCLMRVRLAIPVAVQVAA